MPRGVRVLASVVCLSGTAQGSVQKRSTRRRDTGGQIVKALRRSSAGIGRLSFLYCARLRTGKSDSRAGHGGQIANASRRERLESGTRAGRSLRRRPALPPGQTSCSSRHLRLLLRAATGHETRECSGNGGHLAPARRRRERRLKRARGAERVHARQRYGARLGGRDAAPFRKHRGAIDGGVARGGGERRRRSC